eukprot:1053750-Pleurochrysis_carterae.AAC.1
MRALPPSAGWQGRSGGCDERGLGGDSRVRRSGDGSGAGNRVDVRSLGWGEVQVADGRGCRRGVHGRLLRRHLWHWLDLLVWSRSLGWDGRRSHARLHWLWWLLLHVVMSDMVRDLLERMSHGGRRRLHRKVMRARVVLRCHKVWVETHPRIMMTCGRRAHGCRWLRRTRGEADGSRAREGEVRAKAEAARKQCFDEARGQAALAPTAF